MIKRFIAGAVCPQCKQMDKLVMYTESEQRMKECVSCGFKEQAVERSWTAEPDTRLSKKISDSELSQPIKFLP